MEQHIKARFNDAILHEAMRRYGISSQQIQPLAATENFVYEFQREANSYILRIGHSRRRTVALVEGELDWISYLAAGGVSVAEAIPSAAGKRVELINDGQGGYFLATSFTKAPGQSPYDMWTPALYAAYGQLLGRMHALAVQYQPSQPDWRRPAWDDDIMDFVTRYLPPAEAVAKQKYQAICAYARSLPMDSQCYGLIHFDAHAGNLRVDETGRLTIFDFDECTYSWYANDIAIVLFAMALNTPHAPAVTQNFLPHFLQGYRTAFHIDRRWLQELPVFLKMVEIFLYAVIHRDFDVGNIEDEWCARFMVNRKHKIEQDVPCIDFDFGTLAIPQ